MKKWCLMLCGLAFAVGSHAQTLVAPTLAQLRQYEGQYQYTAGLTLKLAASPRDLCLYALIADARYRLSPVGPDAFRNQGGDTVRFQRDAAGRVASYAMGQQRFRLLKRGLVFPTQMWYPRQASAQPFAYRYTVPAATTDGLPVRTLQGTGLDPALLAAMVGKIVDGSYPNIHSVLIIKDGSLVFEEYFYEYQRDSLHALRSASKSFVSALTGIALARGLLASVQQPVAAQFPEYVLQHNSADKQRITIENLLTNQSGLDCDISNEKSEGNETKMDYSADWVKFTLDLPMLDQPGTTGRYCSGNPITLGRLVEKQAKVPLPEFARRYLFAPLGIKQFNWRFVPDSTSAETYCQLSLRPRDMAKFGLLYLNQGRWQGQQLVPASWVAASLAPHSVVQGVSYGYLWWLKYLDCNGVRYQGAMAQGNGGQRIALWPQQRLVVVVTGGNYNQQSPADELIAKYILAAFNKPALPAVSGTTSKTGR
ncbi:serine hydrolase [Hymenobacter sp. HMF4947]|uniref:Serine hydrolase n=1 Tax=Hymenobacter ginkgonis TaxID=2682976 RepID=A0A7K1TEW9_9BACT|nr:serine hydrolase [Hymenobacter ginkgonis]MVN76963.1 serine hydrolase [Hymenobacter ginkgonis]